MTETPNMIEVKIDGVSLATAQGRNLLSVCLENSIYIPHLCHLEGDDRPSASCRLCFVEIVGMTSPVPACTVTVEPDLRVFTNTEVVRNLQRSALRLLLSAHDIDCKNCHANHHCELQNIARFLKVSLKPSPLPTLERAKELDTGHPFIDHYPHRCVLCGKCIKICRNEHGQPAFSFTGRGIDTVLHHYSVHDQHKAPCPACQSCIDVCPVGALKLKDSE